MSDDGRVFVDTNVLVFAHDISAARKRDTARKIVGELWETRQGCISIQVLQELFITLTRKIPRPLDTGPALGVVENLSTWTVHAPSAHDVITAGRLHERGALSFWDAMIIQSAAELGCDVVYSEDLNPGQRYDGVLVVDPFAGPTNCA